MDGRYRALEEAVKKAERRWKEASRELEEEAARLRAESSARERVGLGEAAKAIEEARRAYCKVDGTPHLLFFPNRLKVFGNAVEDAAKLSGMGLKEAAAAVSISARSGIERLGCDVEDKRGEWHELFSMLKARVDCLGLRLDGELSEWSKRAGEAAPSSEETSGGRKRDEIEIDYWSKGVYGELRRKTDELKALIALVDETGVNEYLRSPGALGIEELREKTALADELSGRLDKLGNLHELRCDASWERREWADAIIDFLEDEINLIWLEEESGWRHTDESGADESGEDESGEDESGEDTRERLELAFRNTAGRKVFIYLVPEEEDMKGNMSVKNRVLIHVDCPGGDEPYFGREILSHVRESLNKSEEPGVFLLIDDVSGLLASPDPAIREAGQSLERRIRGH
jgi:hypothetical protein